MEWKQIARMFTVVGAGGTNLATALTCDFNGVTLTLTPITLLVLIAAMYYMRRLN